MNETSVPALLVRVATHTCALNLAHVVEIMRPLPLEPVAGAPEMVLGLSMIRGTPVPVVALAAVFDSVGSLTTRWVVVRTGNRQVALAVDTVPGVGAFAASSLSAMPPLMRHAASGVVEMIGDLDSELLFVLNTANLIPDELLEPTAGRER